MSTVEAALSKQMQEAEPALDTTRADRKVIQIAYQDLTNYMKFTWQQSRTDMDNMAPSEKMNQDYQENPVEYDQFLAVWAGLWLTKWQKRVKIILSNNQRIENVQNQAKKTIDIETLWQRLNNRQEMTEIIALSLVKNGEICGTQILAENLLKIELAKQTTQDVNKPETQIRILSATLRRAREASQTAGPTLFMKVNNVYFETQKH